MILYDYKCASDHRFEAGVASMSSPAPACPDCGEASRRVLTTVRTSGFASAGHSREDMPKSWKGMAGGHRDAVDYWRRSMEKREKLEERYPELGGDRRPILAHEGIFQGRPLRAGDDIGASVEAAVTADAGKPTGTSGTGSGKPTGTSATGSGTRQGGASGR
ncbi:MAG TPA: zinc ribbon domain-containing protein [Brevibacterium sp.]|nr:zinc ribbon domain-containing protein [Brevibacterium sp.]